MNTLLAPALCLFVVIGYKLATSQVVIEVWKDLWRFRITILNADSKDK